MLNVNGVLKDWKNITLKNKGVSGSPKPPSARNSVESRNLFGISIEQAPQQTLRFVDNCCQWIEGEPGMVEVVSADFP